MSYVDLDYNLTDEQKAARDMARRFAMEEVRPKGIALDKLADPADVADKKSVLWDVFRTYRELGLHKRGMPEDIGGLGGSIDPLSSYLINEQLGYGDGGLAISMSAGSAPFAYAAMLEDPEMRGWAEDYINDTSGEIIGCWPVIEPDHGTDWVLGGEEKMGDKQFAPQVRAVKDGDGYIINGQKAAWVSNGTIATHAAMHLSLDPELGMHGTGICILPLDLPGISQGKPLNKHGQRALNQGELFFEDVFVPAKYMIMNLEMVNAMRAVNTGADSGAIAGPNTGMATTFAGVAWSALDEGIKYASERIQGGVPIREHQNIKLKLMRCFQGVEAARSLARRNFMYNATIQPGSSPHAVAAKALSTETAFNVASEMLQVHGGNGLTKEYCIEKILRDARASMIEDGTNEGLMLSVAQYL
jgi:alkylation response protein AidB-like acyl-CoA dehydrogenase